MEGGTIPLLSSGPRRPVAPAMKPQPALPLIERSWRCRCQQLELPREPKQYASFLTQDWKNKRLTEVSCAPDAMASYFVKDSPLPFETSPVFFNGAVLDKYIADPEKYSLEPRSISCRNAWHLQTYDVNTDGQVHTYLKYLGDLPYSEQLYWKAFNERPKSPISRRAFKTDFEGQWCDDPDPLRNLPF